MMMEGAVLLGGLGLVVVSLYRHLRESRELRGTWQEAAHEAGVQVTSGATWGLGELVGRAGEHRVVISEASHANSGDRTTRIVIEGSSGITLRRETLGTAIEKKLLEDEIQLGDEAFDREIYVRGPARHVRPLLDADARTQLRESVLESSLRLGRTETVLACLAELGRRGDPGAINRLAEVLAKESPTFGVAAARALGTTGEAAAETPLLGALKGDLSEVTRAAVEALGRAGTAAAVLPLQETAVRKGADRRLRRAVGQAVAEIQSRIEGGSPGQLSIADAESGQLSLAGQDPAGRVSIAKPGDQA